VLRSAVRGTAGSAARKGTSTRSTREAGYGPGALTRRWHPGQGPTVGTVPHPGSSIANRLATKLRGGPPLDLVPDRTANTLLAEDEMRTWGPEHDVDADLLRDLLLGRVVTDPDPLGIQLRGARIRGRLDLAYLHTTIALTLLDRLLDEGITANAVHLPALVLGRCRLAHPTEPALTGNWLRVNTLVSLAGRSSPPTPPTARSG